MHRFHHTLTRRYRNQRKINDFRAPSTGVHARSTFENAYPSTLFKGALSPAENAAAKKRGPSGTHGSLCLFEHGRPRKFIRRYCVFAMRTRTGSHAKSPRGPPFRQIVSENAVRVVTPPWPPTDAAHKRPNRAKGARRPHPSINHQKPTHPDPGAGNCASQPPPLGRLFR